MSRVQPVSVSKEAPLKGIFMSNPAPLNFPKHQSEWIGVPLISFSFFQSIWGEGVGCSLWLVSSSFSYLSVFPCTSDGKFTAANEVSVSAEMMTRVPIFRCVGTGI